MFNEAQELIVDRFKHPRFAGILSHADIVVDGINELCGDEVRLEALVKEGRITSLRHTTRACAICSASADLLAENAENKPLEEVGEASTEEITELIGIPLSPIRIKCALLPWETLKQGIQEYQTKIKTGLN